MAWRDEQLTKTQPMSMVDFFQLKRDNNTSGVQGVNFLTSARHP
jgi:hypothetical protein